MHLQENICKRGRCVVDKGSGLRIFGGILLATSGLIAAVNFYSIGQIPGSSVLNIGYLVNIFVFALPIGLVGFFLFLAGRDRGKLDAKSEYAKKRSNIRPLL
jgi:hypothetical protein